MKAVILAAGSNVRLQGLIGNTPKGLYPLNAKRDTLLSCLLAGIAEWDLSQVILVAGANFSKFSRYCSQLPGINVEVIRANPDYVKGPLFTFLTDLPYIDDEDAVVLPADLFISPEGYKFLQNSLGAGGVSLVTQELMPNHHGQVLVKGEILPIQSLSDLTNARTILPISQVTPAFAEFAQEISQAGITRLIDALIFWQQDGRSISFSEVPAFFWVDVDTLEAMQRVQTYLKN
ncbi:MAG TPA: NTP transferase domain-containing protein [Candidatus Lokiarchaeia archaeon]|nr:NTP transferase domain-containing protein [Candidatus Lokiarchaeia archaeon]